MGTARVPALLLAGLLLPWLAGGPASLGAQGSEPEDRASARDEPSGLVWVERTAYAMGTLLRVRAAAVDRPTALDAGEAAFDAVRRAEERLSTWRAGTELAALNAAPPGQAVTVPGALLHLLEEVARWSRATEGAFDPAVGALVDAWDLRGAGRRPSGTELERALAATGLRCFELVPEAGTARRLCPGAWLDAGAFGKGAALREARRALEGAGARAAALDFGGQHLAFGEAATHPSRTLAVAHPSRREEPALRLPWRSGSVATTGQSERGIESAEGRIGHVLDPRTGRPVRPWGSVTVLADDPLVADVLSTALFVMGPDEGLAWAEGRREVAALFLVEEGGELVARANGTMRALLADRREPSAP